MTECFIGSPKAVVSIRPEAHVFIGETVALRCDTKEGVNTQWTYSWYKNNYRLIYNTKQEFIIQIVQYSDSGNFTCRGQRSSFQWSLYSDAVSLTVSGECGFYFLSNMLIFWGSDIKMSVTESLLV